MDFLEKDLEDIICNIENEKLESRGLKIYGKKLRQLRIGDYGIADVVSYSRINGVLVIDVIELKRKVIDVNTLLQALGYARGIQDYIKKSGFSHKFIVNISLIGYSIDTSSNFCYASSVFSNLRFLTYNFNFDGIEFKNQVGWYNAKSFEIKEKNKAVPHWSNGLSTELEDNNINF